MQVSNVTEPGSRNLFQERHYRDTEALETGVTGVTIKLFSTILAE